MDSSKIRNLLEQLDDELDDLEESLEPLIKSALSEASCKLPLLDKAKLYVLVTYAIETILFCERPFLPHQSLILNVSSISKAQWNQWASTSRIHRVDPSQTIFRKATACGESCQKERQSQS